MAKRIDILQTKGEINVSKTIIDKLYNMIMTAERLGVSTYSNDSRLDGTITLNNPVYKEYADKIREIFPLLVINSSYYMLFQDKKMENIMVNHLLSKGVGDGVGITYEDASNILISNMPSCRDNTEIEYFNELVNFTRITSLPNYAFSGCTNLKSIKIQNINSTGYNIFASCTSLTSLELGTIHEIATAFCYGCSNLETVTHNGSLQKINNNGFRDCYLLANIDLSTVTQIGGYAFYGNKSLTNVDLQSLTSVGQYAFYGCTNLVPSNTQNIGNLASSSFNKCTSIESISLGDISSIPDACFADCSNLKTISSTGNILSVDIYAFRRCTSLENIDLSHCTIINAYAFDNTALKSIDLSACTSIKAYAFSECTSLTTVIPRGSLGAYMTAPGDWTRYSSGAKYVEYDPS